MKKFIVTCLLITFTIVGCASTGGTDEGLLVVKDWVVIKRDKSFIGCLPLSKVQGIADDKEYSKIIRESELEKFYGKGLSGATSKLEPFSIVNIWYKVPTSNDAKNYIVKYEVTGDYSRLKDPVVIAAKETELQWLETARQKAEAEKEAARQKAEAEKTKPRYSPEGKEYVKRTLTQVAGEADKTANRGKTLFFESRVDMKEGVTTGQWLVNDPNAKSITVMYYYGEKPYMLIYPTILYRVEISSIGVAKYTIDSFKETVANLWDVLSGSN